MLVFLGASRNDLTYQEYVSYLIALSGLAGIQMFSCIVVFQFRSNLIIELRNPSIIRSSGKLKQFLIAIFLKRNIMFTSSTN